MVRIDVATTASSAHDAHQGQDSVRASSGFVMTAKSLQDARGSVELKSDLQRLPEWGNITVVKCGLLNRG